jgi:hypothetical protein
MKPLTSKAEATLLLLLLVFCSADSFGYINPSSGYILWQAIFGAIVGGLFFVKKICFMIKSFFSKKNN